MAAVWGGFVRISLRSSSSVSRIPRCFSSIALNQVKRSCLVSPFLSRQTHQWDSGMDGFEGSTHTQREETRKWLKEAKKRSWLYRWLHDVDEIEKSIMDDEEYKDRERLIKRMYDLYFDNPEKWEKWDPFFYEEAFTLFMKYNDRAGCEVFLELMREKDVHVDPKFIEKVNAFIKESRDRSWYE